MNRLFNKTGEGAQELVNALGMISDDADFTKWEPVLPMAMRQFSGIVGSDVLYHLCRIYDKDFPAEGTQELVAYAQKAVAFFAWIRVVPTLDAQHGATGRQKKLGENERGMTALQEYKDELNILNLAYEAVDCLVELMEERRTDFWMNSRARKLMDRLLIRNKPEMDEYYHIGSHRLFLVLAPIMREVQRSEILPRIGKERMKALQDYLKRQAQGREGDSGSVTDVTAVRLTADEDLECLLELCRQPLALLTMQKAVERLPVEVIPDGVVQVQQTGTVREKVKAEQAARRSVAESLGRDGEHYLDDLQDFIAALDDTPDNDDYLAGPTLQSAGITF